MSLDPNRAKYKTLMNSNNNNHLHQENQLDFS